MAKPSIRIYPVSGWHYAYVARDTTTERFKIGCTGADLEDRLRGICYDEYGRRSRGKIKVMNYWHFESFFSAFYVEQITVELLKRLGYQRREGDWFAIDRETMTAVVDVVRDVAYEIGKWERENFGASRKAYRRGVALQRSRYGMIAKKLPRGHFGHGLSDLAPE